MAITKIHPIKSTLKKALNYLVEAGKTSEGSLVSSFACSPETADIEFAFTLSHCIEKGNNLAFHLMQSFKPGEIDPKNAHEVGCGLARELLQGKYEFVLSTHVDKDHIHNHLIFCAANFEDYRKFVSNRKTYFRIRKISDKLCEQHGLSLVKPRGEPGMAYKEIAAVILGESWKVKVKRSINNAIKHSSTYDEFLIRMNLSGYEVFPGDRLAFRVPGQKCFIYSTSLNKHLSKESIVQQIKDCWTKSAILRPLDGSVNLYDNTISRKLGRRPLNYHSAKLRKLQEIANAMYQLTNQGINSMSELEGRIPAVKEKLSKVKKSITGIESKISELLETEKQIQVLENVSQSMSKNNTDSEKLIASAKQCLEKKGLVPPYPAESLLQSKINNLQLEKKASQRYLLLLQVTLSDLSLIEKNMNSIIGRSGDKEEKSER